MKGTELEKDFYDVLRAKREVDDLFGREKNKGGEITFNGSWIPEGLLEKKKEKKVYTKKPPKTAVNESQLSQEKAAENDSEMAPLLMVTEIIDEEEKVSKEIVDLPIGKENAEIRNWFEKKKKNRAKTLKNVVLKEHLELPAYSYNKMEQKAEKNRYKDSSNHKHDLDVKIKNDRISIALENWRVPFELVNEYNELVDKINKKSAQKEQKNKKKTNVQLNVPVIPEKEEVVEEEAIEEVHVNQEVNEERIQKQTQNVGQRYVITNGELYVAQGKSENYSKTSDPMNAIKFNDFMKAIHCRNECLDGTFIGYNVVPADEFVKVHSEDMEMHETAYKKVSEVDNDKDLVVVNRKRQFTVQERNDIYAKTQGRCYYCGEFVRFDEYTIDHIIPISRGGTNDMENLTCACKPCNLFKKSYTGDEFFEATFKIAENMLKKPEYAKLKEKNIKSVSDTKGE